MHAAQWLQLLLFIAHAVCIGVDALQVSPLPHLQCCHHSPRLIPRGPGFIPFISSLKSFQRALPAPGLGSISSFETSEIHQQTSGQAPDVRCWEEILYSEGGEVLAQLPREAVDAPSLEVFKVGLDGFLSNLI